MIPTRRSKKVLLGPSWISKLTFLHLFFSVCVKRNCFHSYKNAVSSSSSSFWIIFGTHAFLAQRKLYCLSPSFYCIPMDRFGLFKCSVSSACIPYRRCFNLSWTARRRLLLLHLHCGGCVLQPSKHVWVISGCSMHPPS